MLPKSIIPGPMIQCMHAMCTPGGFAKHKDAMAVAIFALRSQLSFEYARVFSIPSPHACRPTLKVSYIIIS